MIKHRLCLLLIALAVTTLVVRAQESDLAAPTPSAEQSVFFGSIKLLVNMQGQDRHGFYVRVIGSRGGLIGRMMKAVVKLTAENTASHAVTVMEFNERDKNTNPKYMFILPRGTYKLSIESPAINHINGGPVIAQKEFTSPGGGTAVYLGDLSIWGFGSNVGVSQLKANLWIRCNQRKEDIAEFSRRYPQFNDQVTQTPSIGAQEITIFDGRDKPNAPK